MSLRTIVVLALAVVCGLSAAAGVKQLNQQKPVTTAAVGTVQVVVAAADIPRGMTVTKDLVKLADKPEMDIPSDAIRTIEDAVDRAAQIPLLQGELVRDAKLASKDAGRGMAALVPTGMRAYTIHTPTIASGVAGFILPGNKVDVLLTVTEQRFDDWTGGGSTTTLLQLVEVLAVDNQIDAPAENKVDPKQMRSITLLVTPDQANKLSLAQSKGVLHLSLRNDEDGLSAETRPVSLKDLRFEQVPPVNGGEEAKPAAATAPAAAPATTIRPQPVRIRTLRGRDNGYVPLEPVSLGAR
jgi:pilus assembly protein CpaB